MQVFVQKVKRRENGTQGVFEIAPDFRNGGFYRVLGDDTKVIVTEKD